MFYPVQVVSLMFLLLRQCEVKSVEIAGPLTMEKCYDELGCFSTGSPFFDAAERPLSLPPEEREVVNTMLLLYTRRNPSAPQKFSNLHYSESEVMESNFDPKLDTKIVVPGFISDMSPEWKMPLVIALLKDHDCNVFLVDWSGGDGPVYEQAVANTRVAGAEIALFVSHLEDLFEVDPKNIHLIGHSLGAHISGYAGKRIQNLGRITGMDPAGPCFTHVDPVVRLDRGDALFVDIIHTNAKPKRFQGFGNIESIGHFDFYPNGGSHQPGCKDSTHAILSLFQNPTAAQDNMEETECDHLRAIYLFMATLRSEDCQLMGVLCDSWQDYVAGACGTCDDRHDRTCVALGAHADHYKSVGIQGQSMNFYLNTTDTEPFCL